MPVLLHAGGVLDLFASKISLKFVGLFQYLVVRRLVTWFMTVRDKAQEDCINRKCTFCILRACLHGGGDGGEEGGWGVTRLSI